MSELQGKIYHFLEQLQRMTTEIPAELQQRIPNELLSGLATSLAEGPIFEIVSSLTEVQNATEKHLFHQRLLLLKSQSNEKLQFQTRYQETVCNLSEPSEVLSVTKELDTDKVTMDNKHKEEMKHFDMKTILKLDQQVMDQQSTLEKAGVPGFYVTNDPTNIRVQMHLLKCIAKMDEMEQKKPYS